jgi:hypothetical protein
MLQAGLSEDLIVAKLRKENRVLDLSPEEMIKLKKLGCLKLFAPLEFIIRCPEGVSAAEYQLLQLDEKSDRREFRAVTGGILHASSGAEKNAVAFKFDKVSSRTFKIKLTDIKQGEYGFLPPGAYTSASAASSGKPYTFRIPE